jgi:threonine 3-dehydrogenase
MKALVFDQKNGNWENTVGFEKADVPEPTIEESKVQSDASAVIIKIHYAGVCGSDRGIWFRQAFRDQILGSLATEKKTVRVIGHESFGEIVALGSAAGKKYNLKRGDFVSCESHVNFQNSFQFKLGEVHVCTNEKILGISVDGCFAEYLKVPGHIVWKTDTSKIRPEIGAVQEPFGNAVHAASKTPLAGKTIAIFGLGPIGLFLTLVARGLGAKHIIGIEPNPVSQEMAKRLGIDYCLTIPPRAKNTPPYHRDEAVVKSIESLTNGLGVDVAFEMSGFNSSLNNALFSTRRGGQVIAFGIKGGDFTLEDYNRFIVRGLTVHAVIGRRVPETWKTTTALMENPENKIQENIWNIILEKGKDTVLPIDEYTKDVFAEKMAAHPKILLQF